MRFEPDSLYFGDCLKVMQQWPDESVDLCYLDPPFNSKTNYNVLFGRERQNGFAQLTAFEDTWQWDGAAQERVDAIERAVRHPAHRIITGLRIALGECGMLAYLSYMAERLAEIRRLLKPTGSVYYHCDPTASHYLKVVMDAVFEQRNFRNEIVWAYQRWTGATKHFQRMHDCVLMFARSNHSKFNQLLEPHSAKGRRRHKGKTRKTTIMPDGTMVQEYVGGLGTKAMRDVWEISFLNANAKERLGYPTQKPLSLLERIIEASSNHGDIVLDPFCGCGTTVEAARKLGRRFVGIDISHFAIDLVRNRRLKDARIPVHGVPVDMATAERMAHDEALEFEKWAVTRVPGMVPNDRQVGDGGIDGRGTLLSGGLVLAQVKGGSFQLGQLRDFRHVMAREDAACGVFTTLRPVRSRNARTEAHSAGFLELGATRYPKTQLWSIADYFDHRPPVLPALADPYTGKAMQGDLFA